MPSTMKNPHLTRSLALISEGFFLFSSANTTVNSRPRRICPSIWYLASSASAGSTNWTKPKPRGSLKHTHDQIKFKQTNSSPYKHADHNNTISNNQIWLHYYMYYVRSTWSRFIQLKRKYHVAANLVVTKDEIEMKFFKMNFFSIYSNPSSLRIFIKILNTLNYLIDLLNTTLLLLHCCLQHSILLHWCLQLIPIKPDFHKHIIDNQLEHEKLTK